VRIENEAVMVDSNRLNRVARSSTSRRKKKKKKKKKKKQHYLGSQSASTFFSLDTFMLASGNVR